MFLNKPYLSNIAKETRMDSTTVRTQVLHENHQIFFAKRAYDVFLSHSYLDQPLVYTIVDLFNAAGYSVYVDWMVDTQLDRNEVTAATAKTLRTRMDTCQGLAYIATANISNSKWCPWELGYMDGKKNGRCAILPVLDNQTSTFSGQEYLGIYPYIDYEKTSKSGQYDFWVNDPTDRQKYVSLKDWLKGEDPYKHE